MPGDVWVVQISPSVESVISRGLVKWPHSKSAVQWPHRGHGRARGHLGVAIGGGPEASRGVLIGSMRGVRPLRELESWGLLIRWEPDEWRLRLHLLPLLRPGDGLSAVNQVDEVLRHARVPEVFRRAHIP